MARLWDGKGVAILILLFGLSFVVRARYFLPVDPYGESAFGFEFILFWAPVAITIFIGCFVGWAWRGFVMTSIWS